MHHRVPPTVGIVAALVFLVVLALPFGMAPVDQVTSYYGSGAISAYVPGLFALVAVLALAAGRQERSRPDFAAGVALVVGLFAVGLATVWALTVRIDTISLGSLVVYHRWALVVAAAVLPASALLYARTLRLL